jgi:4-hydroxybenzoate polyprenyltransferase
VYILNDICDIASDRAHPKKCFRPLASGAVKVPLAVTLLVILLTVSLVGAAFINLNFLIICIVYFVIMLLYSVWLKHIPIIDVMIIAIGFVIRAIAGGLAINVVVSPWLIICTSFLALFLVLGKRKGEIDRTNKPGIDNGNRRKVLDFYTSPMLKTMSGSVDGATILSYCLYCMSFTNTWMLITIPYVIYGLFRYEYLAYCGTEDMETVENLLLRDKPLIIDLLLWAATCAAILYLS